MTPRAVATCGGWRNIDAVALVASGFTFMLFRSLSLLCLGVWWPSDMIDSHSSIWSTVALRFGMRAIARSPFAEALFSFAFSFAR